MGFGKIFDRSFEHLFGAKPDVFEEHHVSDRHFFHGLSHIAPVNIVDIRYVLSNERGELFGVPLHCGEISLSGP